MPKLGVFLPHVAIEQKMLNVGRMYTRGMELLVLRCKFTRLQDDIDIKSIVWY